jgi:type IV pilus assembly protein PilQ
MRVNSVFARLFAVFTALMIVLGPSVASAQVTEYITLNVSGEDIKNVVKGIARSTGVNIITDKNVSGKVTVLLKEVYYEKALELIAKTNGLTVRKEGNTYIIGRPKDLAEAFDTGLNRAFKLSFANPEDVKNVISDVFKTTTESPVKVAVDKRINAVIVQATKDQLKQIETLVKELDVKVHQVLIEAKIVEVTTSGLRDLGVDWGWDNKKGSETTSNTGKIAAITEAQVKSPVVKSYRPEIDEKYAGEVFSFGDFYRGPMFFEATLKAVEESGSGKLLSNPKIAALNGQKANIEVGQKVAYKTGGDQGSAEKDVGIKLTITPQINDEGWITCTIQPEVSFVERWTNDNLPLIGRRLADTTVRVKDGEEILIGGLIKEKSDITTARVPILGHIPLLKMFFSSRKTTDETLQLIILVKPSIVPEQEV